MTTTTITTVSNGTTTKQIDTNDMNIAEYEVQVDYQSNQTYTGNTAQSKLTIKDGSAHSIGLGTDTPWTRDIVYKGGINDTDGVYVDYAHTPTIIQIPLEGDFTVTIETKMNCLQSFGNFGFTTNPTQLNAEIRIYQNSINNNITIPNVYTQAEKIETVTITRVGNTYTYTQNGNTYTTTVNNPGKVYLYGQKNGNCALMFKNITYQNL